MADNETVTPAAGQNRTTAAGRYEQLVPTRTPYLERARTAATLTIPGLMPPEGHTGSQSLPQPWQSVGADGVNNLSAKLLMALFPPGSGFFRLTMDDFTVEKLKANAAANGEDGEDARATFEKALGKVERAAVNKMEQRGARIVNHEALQHLIVTGNGLVEVKDDVSEKFFPLDRYVVKRDLDGAVLEIIAKESLARMELPARVQGILQAKQPSAPETDNEKNVDLYTWVRRTESGAWRVHQEVEGSIIPGSEGTYPAGKCAWIPLRWRAIPGEDYGRGRVEEYLGDHVSCEALSKAVTQLSVQAAKVLWFVDPNGTTDKEDVAKAPTGTVLEGNAQKDITTLALDKLADFQVSKAQLDAVTKRLERAYLQASAVQRDAERVTAEEIRAMIGELEQGLGGVYTILATEFQLPLAARVLQRMKVTGQIPKLPDDIVAPQIVTGLGGLSRMSDAQKLDSLLAGVAQMFGPEAVAQSINIGGYIERKGAALGIDTSGIVKSQQQVEKEQQAAAQQEAVNKMGPAALKVAGDAARQASAAQPTQ